MGRRRDHYPRFNTKPCPDPRACARLYHGIGGPDSGDVCECCGREVVQLPEWEAVRERSDGGRIVYWRLQRADGSSVGAVSLKPEGWRALAYGSGGVRGRSHAGRRELGHFPTRRKAAQAVEDVAWEEGR